MSGWVGVDLDGTLAKYDKDKFHADNLWIGEPIPFTQALVKHILSLGYTVKVFTARVSNGQYMSRIFEQKAAIKDWTEEHLGIALESTCEKDFHMWFCIDDRAIGIEYNTGELCTYSSWLGKDIDEIMASMPQPIAEEK